MSPSLEWKVHEDRKVYFILFYFILIFYLFIGDTEREREREAETEAEGEAGSTQGARHGTRFWDSRITPCAEGRC